MASPYCNPLAVRRLQSGTLCAAFSINTMNFDATGPTRPLTRDKSAPPRGACGVECHINRVATSSSKDLSTKASPRYQKVALRQKINNQKQTKQTNRTTSRRQIWDYFKKSKTKNIFILFCEMWYDVEKIFTHINVCVCQSRYPDTRINSWFL